MIRAAGALVFRGFDVDRQRGTGNACAGSYNLDLAGRFEGQSGERGDAVHGSDTLARRQFDRAGRGGERVAVGVLERDLKAERLTCDDRFRWIADECQL